MPRRPKHPPKEPASEGARLLRAVPGTLQQISTAIGAKSPNTVMDFRSGRRRPSPELREALSRVYGIPTDCWGSAESAPVPAAKPVSAASAPDQEIPELSPEQLTGKLKPTKEECEDQLLRVRAAASDPNCSPASASRLGIEIRGLLKLRHQLEADEPWEHGRIAESTAFRAIAERIAEAVYGCDRCSKALEPVLGRTQ